MGNRFARGELESCLLPPWYTLTVLLYRYKVFTYIVVVVATVNWLTRDAFQTHSKLFGFFRQLEINCYLFRKGYLSSSDYHAFLHFGFAVFLLLQDLLTVVFGELANNIDELLCSEV